MSKIFYTADDLHLIKREIKRVFFYRVCGTGMGAAATLLKESGLEVEGGDNEFYPPMSTYLEKSGIKLKKISDCSDEYLKKFDLIIVGNVVPKKSKDALRLEALDTKLTSFPEALGGLLLREKSVIGVAGTHGKTTTTYLGVQVFRNMGVDVGHLIGGVLPEGPSAKVGASNLFFVEADEYDTAYFQKTSKFLHYDINHLILTSLEYDHADIFENEDEILESFNELFRKDISNKILNLDYFMTKTIFNSYGADLVYGGESDIGPHYISHSPGKTKFSLLLGGEHYEFATNLDKGHNIQNLSSIILLAYSLNHSVSEIQESIKNLRLVKRRQEIIGKICDSILIDDFAHHPTAIEKTLETVEDRYPGMKIIAIFEPASSTARSDLFQDRFAISLNRTSEVVILPPQRDTTVINGGNLNIDSLKSELEKNGKKVFLAKSLKELENTLSSIACEDKIIVCLSNGKLLNLYSSRLIQK